MKDFKVGAGGWAYFQVPGMDSLVAYSKAFNFVEVNSTFYEIPSLDEVSSWRKRSPPDFEFSIRCHRDLTHKYRLEPRFESYRILSKMLDVCKTLEANILHIQTPATFEITPPKTNSIRDLLSSFDFKGVRIAWESRRGKAKKIKASLVSLMRDLDIIPCVDLSREVPPFATDILYSRLFGKGSHNVYQFDDEELKTVDWRASEEEHKKTVLSFHGVRMYKDAARFKRYKQTGEFPPVTSSSGLSSLREVLSEDSEFPTTRDKLIRHQGWKVFDLTSTKRVHAEGTLQKLPNQTFHNLEEVIQKLEGQDA